MREEVNQRKEKKREVEHLHVNAMYPKTVMVMSIPKFPPHIITRPSAASPVALAHRAPPAEKGPAEKGPESNTEISP